MRERAKAVAFRERAKEAKAQATRPFAQGGDLHAAYARRERIELEIRKAAGAEREQEEAVA